MGHMEMETPLESEIKVRMTFKNRTALARLAVLDGRTLSDYVRRILTAHIEDAAA